MIIEYLEEDVISLGSCLLVNRFWCRVTVGILWRNVWNILNYKPYQKYVSSSILSTLTACLPNESKNLLYTNGILIPMPTSKPPLFNYISFIKVLLYDKLERMIGNALTLNNERIYTSHDKHLVSQELLKAFMNQISSLKILDYDLRYQTTVQNIPFISFLGAKDCLTDLTEFKCDSNVYPELFHQLSQICHHIRSLTIRLSNNVSNGLKELISSQNHLKDLGLVGYDNDSKGIISVLKKHHNTLTRLHISVGRNNETLSFIGSFKNLQELVITTFYSICNDLQYVIFPN